MVASAAAFLAVCVVVLVAVNSQSAESSETELLLDSDTIADKILKNQHFHKANTEEREKIVKSILAKGPAGSLANKMAQAVADKHETYRQRIDAMKKLLDMHTSDLKEGKAKEHLHGPSAAGGKQAARGRKPPAAAHHSAKDHTSAKAVQDGLKLLHETKKGSSHRLHMPAREAKIKAEFAAAEAKPSKLDLWMKKQVNKAATAARAAKESHGRHGRHLSEAHEDKQHTSSSAPRKLTKYQRLVKWAEAHGLPHKLADNPKDRTKVKHIIARMKADLEVEEIRHQFAKDDAKVGDVIHSADPGAAGAV